MNAGQPMPNENSFGASPTRCTCHALTKRWHWFIVQLVRLRTAHWRDMDKRDEAGLPTSP